MQKDSLDILKEFKTVVSGYRLHGILTHFQQNSNQLIKNAGQKQTLPQTFTLNISSVGEKSFQRKLQINTNQLQKPQFLPLKQYLKSPGEIYDYLSKLTKVKLRLNQIQNEKLFILIDKQNKQKYQHQINLVAFTQKAQDQETNHEKKTQQEVELKQQDNEVLNTSTDTRIPIDLATKIEELRRERQAIGQPNKPKQEKQPRQMKQVKYQFKKQTAQQETLYEVAFHNCLEQLTTIIETQQVADTNSIVLKRCRIVEMPPFNQLRWDNLREINLQENNIKKIENLEAIANLQKLNLEGNKIKDINNLEKLSRLKFLKLGNNDITTIQGVDLLVQLETLWLDFNNISKIQNLSKLKNLKSLNLSFNLITKIQNLGNLNNLEDLLLNENQLTQIQGLESLTKLTRLSLNFNQIKEIKGVKKLLLLESLYLVENEIYRFDQQAFEEINWLKMLKELKLSGNMIEWNQTQKKFLQRVKNYGVKVLS